MTWSSQEHRPGRREGSDSARHACSDDVRPGLAVLRERQQPGQEQGRAQRTARDRAQPLRQDQHLDGQPRGGGPRLLRPVQVRHSDRDPAAPAEEDQRVLPCARHRLHLGRRARRVLLGLLRLWRQVRGARHQRRGAAGDHDRTRDQGQPGRGAHAGQVQARPGGRHAGAVQGGQGHERAERG